MMTFEPVSRAAPSVFQELKDTALAHVDDEPLLASALHAAIIHHSDLASALSYVLAHRLGGDGLDPMQLREITECAYAERPELLGMAERDMRAVADRDPACRSLLQPFLYFKGYHALQAHRLAHWLWGHARQMLAFHLQARVSERMGVDIHPAARMGCGVMIDHATAIVIGETAVVGDNCSLLHEVTLGGTGVQNWDRHPKIGEGVLIGAGAKVLGNISVGDFAKIASGSVVLDDVPSRCTVAGVPARPVGGPCCPEPARTMEHGL
jgi:serine O-acetyltransferase